MDNRIYGFIDSLKKKLDGLPQEEIEEAASYYEEYLNDAAEAGKDLDEIIMQLGSPDKIAGKIRTETSIIRAQHNPGLKNFASVLKNAFHIVTTPFTVLFLSVFVVISYSMVAVLFAGAFVTLLAAVAAILALGYEAFAIPSRFAMEIAGTLGLAFLAGGILFLLAFGQYKLGRLFIRISIRLIRLMVSKPGEPMPGMKQHQSGKKSASKRIIYAGVILSIAGLVLFSVSGIPVKYFTIFNSMKPEDVTLKTSEFDPEGISKISLVTAHSHVKLASTDSDKITISYEQPDWLDYDISRSGSMLSFYEKSNGRLPLFHIVSLHESRTELKVSIPEGYSPDILMVESKGGYVYITSLAENIEVKTYTGGIGLESKKAADSFNIEANTENGYIEVDGTRIIQRTNHGTEYYRNIKAEKTITLRSSRGNINIR